jgi:co-chaperonin GroES (HSP10)
MTFIQPLHSNLIVEPFELGEISRGGLLIPQVAKASTPYRYAKVLAIGPGRHAADGRLIAVTPQPGDVVAYARNQGVEMPLESDGIEKTVLLINEQYLLGIVRDMPEQTTITGLDGQLMKMRPGSHARSDGTYAQLDAIARAGVDGILDTAGDFLQKTAAADEADHRAEGE